MKELVAVRTNGTKKTVEAGDRILVGKNLIRKVVRNGERNGLYVKDKGERLYLSQVNIIQKV